MHHTCQICGENKINVKNCECMFCQIQAKIGINIFLMLNTFYTLELFKIICSMIKKSLFLANFAKIVANTYLSDVRGIW